MIFKRKALVLTLSLSVCNSVYADISGTVFRDYNYNSIQESEEPGEANLTIKAYGDNNLFIASDTTDESGNFNLITNAGTYRVEIDTLPSYLNASAIQGSGGSSELTPNTSAVMDGTVGVKIGLSNPSQYIDNTAKVIAALNSNGKTTGNTQSAIRVFPQHINDFEDIDPPIGAVDIARIQNIGSVWGVAYDAANEIVYATSLLRRHSAVGPLGLGGVYKVDISDINNSVISNFTTVANTDDGTVPDNDSRNLPTDRTDPSHDPVFDQIGRMGLGDIDISEDGNKLYTINLHTNALIEIDISNPSTQSSHNIGDPFGGCSDVRSWAVNVHDGQVYVGSVCTTDLTKGAAISAWDGTNFNTIHTVDLSNITKDYTVWTQGNQWNTWVTTYNQLFDGAGTRIGYPQPILTDIIFEEKEAINLGFMDRSGFQAGYKNYSPNIADTNQYEQDSGGDIYRVCIVNGNYYNEGSPECPYPETTENEYFFGESMVPHHDETALGGLAYKQGSNLLLSSVYDAVDNGTVYASGVRWLSTISGDATGGVNQISEYWEPGAFGKSGGIGDIELLSTVAPIEIGDYVWHDSNNNGIQDPSESPIANVVVRLYEGATEVGSATTNSNGYYYFGGLQHTNMSGSNPLKTQTTYQLRIDLSDSALNGMIPTFQGAESAEQRDSDGDNGQLNGGFSTIQYTTSNAGENLHDLDFGFTTAPKSTLGNKVWNDENKDGIQDANESGVSGVVVKLYEDCSGAEVNSTVTNANGIYGFSGLEDGDYCVGFELPDGYAVSPQDAGSDDSQDSDVNSESMRTPTISLSNGDINTTLDMGIYFAKASLGDYVWLDANQNGIQESGENGVSHVTVTLYANDCRNERNTTVTDSNGLYLFENLDAGDYCVGFSNVPAGHAITTKEATGSTPTNNSDVDPLSQTTDLVTLAEGENNRNLDMGLYPLASIGDFVWHDLNRNGTQDAGESGIEGVNVTLLTDCNEGTVAGTTSTDANGAYLFANIIPANYCVMFTLPSGYEVTLQGAGSSNDSDVNATTMKTPLTTISPAEADMDWDMGLYQLARLGDRVWLDQNGNGIQESNESGVAGVTVELLASCDTAQVVDTKVTDSNGSYLFTDIVPGEYCVQFSALPSDHYVTIKNAVGSSDATDSDADTSTLRTVPTTLTSGEEDLTWDMGIGELGSLGDRVWLDSNANGIQDANESGVTNVKVTLYNQCNTAPTEVSGQYTDSHGGYLFTNLASGSYCVAFSELPAGANITPQDTTDDASDSDVDPATGRTVATLLSSGEHDLSWDMGIYYVASLGDTVWEDSNANGVQESNESGVANVLVTLYAYDCTTELDTTTTDTHGSYRFSNLMPSTYCLEFNPPEGYHFSAADSQVTDDTHDSDANQSTRKTGTITLVSSQNDTAWDAGLYRTASLGDYVWIDSNKNGVQDASEAGVANITVTLYQECNSSTPIELNSTTTDNNGSYRFEDLIPHDYCVMFSNLPVNYYITTQDNGSDDNNDSDADPSTRTTISTDLSSGEHDPSWDMGIYYQAPSITPTPSPTPTPTVTPTPVTPQEEPSEEEEESNETSPSVITTPPVLAQSPETNITIQDDRVEADPNTPRTVISVLSNDDVQEGVTIRFVALEEGETSWNEDGVVAGTHILQQNTLIVPGEGIWTIENGNIVFTAEEGFNGIPTPIYYIVKDEEGTQSNVAQVSITTPCVCEPFDTKAQDAVPVLNAIGIFFMLFFSSLVSAFFLRKEER